MTGRWLDLRSVIGAAAGTATALAGAWLAEPRSEGLPYTVLLVLAIGIVGLALGARAALAAYATGAVLLILLALLPHPGAVWEVGDGVRFTISLLGSAIVVFLVSRAEANRLSAGRALAASRQAEVEAETERLRVEQGHRDRDQALADAERDRARLEEVAEAILEPLIVYDNTPVGIYANRAALRVFGRSFVERSLDDWGRAVQPRDELGAPLPREDWPQVRAQRAPFRGRQSLRIPMSGRDVIVDVEGMPIAGGGAVLLLRDIGKEEDERRRLSRFASFVAHELRNPLAVAKARMELAEREPVVTERRAGHAQRALESVEAAIRILERLELFSRADAGPIAAKQEPFELNPALATAIERLRAQASERPVLVTAPDGVLAVGDQHLSEQAITNLLTNADRYSVSGGSIHIEVTVSDRVTLRVRDDGPGIEEAVASRLFADRLDVGRGLGLGLYLVRTTMEAMGGSVQLEQRTPHAVFALRWQRPAAPSEAEDRTG